MNDPHQSERLRVTRQQRRAAERKEKKNRRRLAGLTASAAVLVGAGSISVAGANTITVNSTADTVVAGPPPADGQCTLREALINANDPTGTDGTNGDCAAGSPAGSQDIIVFASSVTGTIALTQGTLNISDSVAINGPGPATLAVDGADANAIFGISPAAIANVSISGLTLQNGNSIFGGAIQSRSANLTIDNAVFSSNVGYIGGGAIFFDATGATSLTVSNSTISGNSVTNNGPGGGGVLIKYGGAGSNFVFDHVTLSGNSTPGLGGAIADGSDCGSALTIRNSVLSGNTAAAGGGLVITYGYRVLGTAPSANVRSDAVCASSALIEDSTVTGNTASLDGGGIAVVGANLTVSRTTVANNTSVNDGGGVFVGYYGSATIENSTITGNSGAHGGGIFVLEEPLAVNNATINGNTATAAGPNGGGVYVGGPGTFASTIANSIVAGNTGGTDVYVYTPVAPATGGPTVTVSFSDVQNPPAAAANYIDGGGNLSVDPQLGPLQNNGGPTQGNGGTAPTLTELPGLPVIDKANTATSLPVDQRSVARPQGAATDMGAVEVVPAVFSFSSSAYAGAEGTSVTVTVTRTGGDLTGSVDVVVTGGTATNGSDYTFAPTTLTFAPTDTTKTVTIPLAADGVFDPNETINLALQNPTTGTTVGPIGTAVVTISEVGTPGTISGSNVTVNENAGTATITLTRTGGSNGPVTVNFSTTPGTATAGADYTAVTGSVQWLDGDVAPKTFTIPILTDSVPEPPETFAVNLSTPSTGAVIATPVLTVTILDPATVPTLAFWMKLMLALTCAGVGIVMLKNGRMLVIVAATGLALASAPKLLAAPRPATSSARTFTRTAVAGTIATIAQPDGNVAVKVGTTTVSVPRSRFRVIDAAHRRAFAPVESAAPGMPALLVVRRDPSGHAVRARLILFKTVEAATAAATRFAQR